MLRVLKRTVLIRPFFSDPQTYRKLQNSCLIEIFEGLNEGQLHYLTELKGPQEGTYMYLYTTQFLTLR